MGTHCGQASSLPDAADAAPQPARTMAAGSPGPLAGREFTRSFAPRTSAESSRRSSENDPNQLVGWVERSETHADCALTLALCAIVISSYPRNYVHGGASPVPPLRTSGRNVHVSDGVGRREVRNGTFPFLLSPRCRRLRNAYLVVAPQLRPWEELLSYRRCCTGDRNVRVSDGMVRKNAK